MVRDDVTYALASAVVTAVSKAPSERFSSAAQFAAALAEASTSEQDAASLLRQTVARDFRDPRIAAVLNEPSLDELEKSWLVSMRPPPPPLCSTPPAAAEPQVERLPAVDVDGTRAGAPEPTGKRRPLFVLVAIGVVAVALAAAAVAGVMSFLGEPGEGGAEETSATATGYTVVQGGAELEGAEPPAAATAKKAATATATIDAQVAVEEREPEPAAEPAEPTPEPVEEPETTVRRAPRAVPQEDSLTRTFSRRRGRLRACFREHAASIQGDPHISVDFGVDRSGRVETARLIPAALGSTPLGRCVLGVARSTRFGPQGDATTFRIPVRVTRE
jgi:hypothetical protein